MSISGKQAFYYQHQSYSSIYFRENGTCQKRTDSSEEQAFELMLSKHLADELHLHTRQTLFYENHEEPIADFIEEFQSQRQPTTPVIRTKNRPGTSSKLHGAPRKGYFRLYQKGEFRSRFANKDVHEFNKVKNKTHPLEVQIMGFDIGYIGSKKCEFLRIQNDYYIDFDDCQQLRPDLLLEYYLQHGVLVKN